MTIHSTVSLLWIVTFFWIRRYLYLFSFTFLSSTTYVHKQKVASKPQNSSISPSNYIIFKHDTSPFLESEPSVCTGKIWGVKPKTTLCDVSKYINYMPTSRPATFYCSPYGPTCVFNILSARGRHNGVSRIKEFWLLI